MRDLLCKRPVLLENIINVSYCHPCRCLQENQPTFNSRKDEISDLITIRNDTQPQKCCGGLSIAYVSAWELEKKYLNILDQNETLIKLIIDLKNNLHYKTQTDEVIAKLSTKLESQTNISRDLEEELVQTKNKLLQSNEQNQALVTEKNKMLTQLEENEAVIKKMTDTWEKTKSELASSKEQYESLIDDLQQQIVAYKDEIIRWNDHENALKHRWIQWEESMMETWNQKEKSMLQAWNKREEVMNIAWKDWKNEKAMLESEINRYTKISVLTKKAQTR